MPIKRCVQPDAGTIPAGQDNFALLFVDRMLRNLGTPIHCFKQLMRAIFLRSSLITRAASTQNLAPSRFATLRPRRAMGSWKWRAPCAKGHMMRSLVKSPPDNWNLQRRREYLD